MKDCEDILNKFFCGTERFLIDNNHRSAGVFNNVFNEFETETSETILMGDDDGYRSTIHRFIEDVREFLSGEVQPGTDFFHPLIDNGSGVQRPRFHRATLRREVVFLSGRGNTEIDDGFRGCCFGVENDPERRVDIIFGEYSVTRVGAFRGDSPLPLPTADRVRMPIDTRSELTHRHRFVLHTNQYSIG